MRKWFPLLVVLLVSVLFACSKQSTSPQEQAALSTGEIPSEVQARLDQYAILDEDALASLAPGHSDLTNNFDDFDVYAVTYLWGAFFPHGGSPLVWDGRTGTNAEAAMRVVTDIDFEDGEEILADSTRPFTFGWISSTLNDLDGVSFLLFVKRGVEYIVPPELAFETPPISFAIPIDDLGHHVSFHPVDHASGVAVFSRQIRNTPCPHGFLGGKWVFEGNSRTEGMFGGDWLSADHQLEGRLSGRFFTDPDGHRLLRGQVSGVVTDEVIIELEGIWCLTPHLSNVLCPTCDRIGYFVGRWKYADGSGGGKFAGHFGEPDMTTDLPDLPFRGVWMQHCDDHAGDQSWSSNDK